VTTAKKPLPKIAQPIYEMTLPSNGKIVRFRPFTVKEEKLLMMAMETKAPSDIYSVYTQIINNCIVDDIDVDEMAVVDIELFFLRLRARSVSNVAEFLITDASDQKEYKVSVNLDEVNASIAEGHTNVIKLTDMLSVRMRYPTFKDAEAYSRMNQIDAAQATKMLFRSCIDVIFTDDEVYDPRDYDDAQLEEFFDGFRRPQLEAIERFVVTMPVIRHTVEYTREDGTAASLELVGIDSFF